MQKGFYKILPKKKKQRPPQSSAPYRRMRLTSASATLLGNANGCVRVPGNFIQLKRHYIRATISTCFMLCNHFSFLIFNMLDVNFFFSFSVFRRSDSVFRRLFLAYDENMSAGIQRNDTQQYCTLDESASKSLPHTYVQFSPTSTSDWWAIKSGMSKLF